MIKKLLAAFTAITLLAPFTPNDTMMKAFSEDESSILYDEEMKEYLASDDAHYSIEDFTYNILFTKLTIIIYLIKIESSKYYSILIFEFIYLKLIDKKILFNLFIRIIFHNEKF